MHIEKFIVENYRSLKRLELDLNPHLNIIVGDNETGKSTILEAINLVLSGQLNGRSIHYELHPFLFNADVIEEYIRTLQNGQVTEPPKILLEVYLHDIDDFAKIKGTNNTKGFNKPGIYMSIEFDPEYNTEYQRYIKKPNEVKNIPIEYYKVVWRSFAEAEGITSRTVPVKPLLIDASKGTNTLGASRHVVDIVRSTLTESQLAEVSLAYRRMKDQFSNDTNIQHINEELSKTKGEITDKDLSVSLDTMSRSGWDSGIVPHLDTIPLVLAGKGEQSMIKIKLAMQKAAENNIFLIEEPENHLSFSNLNNLISKIKDQSEDRQLIITTHSSFVLNKLGVENVLFFNGDTYITLKDMQKNTHDYFMKLPGHDTLRLILAKQAILVEGPSDELIVQKAFLKQHGKMPLELGIDVITVGLAFKRFLEIAVKLNITVKVITDNDKDVAALEKKYRDYTEYENIQIYYDRDENYQTLEPQLLKANSLTILNNALGKNFDTEKKLLDHMESNKTTCALRLFDTEEDFNIPEYIQNAIV